MDSFELLEHIKGLVDILLKERKALVTFKEETKNKLNYLQESLLDLDRTLERLNKELDKLSNDTT